MRLQYLAGGDVDFGPAEIQTQVTSVNVGISALTVRTYSVKANIQTEKKVRRGISGQPVLILNHQHRGQNQSRCDSITNEGQITGM